MRESIDIQGFAVCLADAGRVAWDVGYSVKQRRDSGRLVVKDTWKGGEI